MTDIFREIEEDLRHERLKRAWDRYGIYVIAAAVLVVVATAGWRGYEAWRNAQARASGDALVAALAKAEEGDSEAAIRALDELIESGSGGYPVLARFRKASELAQIGKAEEAVALFDAIANGSGTPKLLGDLARVRAGAILLDAGDRTAVEEHVRPVADGGGPFRNAASELMGLAAWKDGDAAAAQPWFDRILGDPSAPFDLRQRAEIMQALIIAALAPAPAQSGEAPREQETQQAAPDTPDATPADPAPAGASGAPPAEGAGDTAGAPAANN